MAAYNEKEYRIRVLATPEGHSKAKKIIKIAYDTVRLNAKGVIEVEFYEHGKLSYKEIHNEK
jgi:hypothetical protein